MNFEEGNFYLNDCPNSSSNQHKNQNFMNPKIRVCRYVSRKSHLHGKKYLNALNNDVISAHKLFDKTPHRTICLWNSLIRGYARAHKFRNAFSLFNDVLHSEIMPDNFTYACLVKASSENFDLHSLRVLHGGVVLSGLQLDFICRDLRESL
uniref:Pentatricopeptide repeat-containing protein n=1 Tax=Solanum lycopersicum TaxID=4081 RepID=K4C5Q8_SOLLC